MVCTAFIVDPDHIPFSWLISTFFVDNILVFPVSILNFGDWNSSNSSPVPISSIIFPQSFRLSLTFPRFTTILSFFSNCFHVFPIFCHIFRHPQPFPLRPPLRGPRRHRGCRCTWTPSCCRCSSTPRPRSSPRGCPRWRRPRTTPRSCRRSCCCCTTSTLDSCWMMLNDVEFLDGMIMLVSIVQKYIGV